MSLNVQLTPEQKQAIDKVVGIILPWVDDDTLDARELLKDLLGSGVVAIIDPEATATFLDPAVMREYLEEREK